MTNFIGFWFVGREIDIEKETEYTKEVGFFKRGRMLRLECGHKDEVVVTATRVVFVVVVVVVVVAVSLYPIY